MKVFIIPGNPPASFYYGLWVNDLEKIYGSGSIAIEYFPRFSKKLSSEQYFERMYEFYLEKLRTFARGEKVLLIGHSIGAYLSLKILERERGLVKKNILIFPFIGKPMKKGEYILKLSETVDKNFLLKNLIVAGKASLHRVIPPLENIGKAELKNGLRFAHKEKLYFQDRRFPKLTQEMAKKIEFFFTQNDTWCPERTIQYFQQRVSSHYVDSRHDFVVAKTDRDRVTKLLVELVSP